MVTVGQNRMVAGSHTLFRPSLRTSHRNREQGGAVVKVVAASHARRVTLTSATACFIGKLKFEGKRAIG
jgi:hypothetical protein